MNYEIYYKQKGADRFSSIEHSMADRFEIILLLEGEGTVLAGAAVYPMIRGALYFIDMSKPHCTCPSSADKYIRNKLIMETGVFEAFLKSAFAIDIVEEAMRSGSMCVPLEESGIREADACFLSMYRNKGDQREIMLALLKLVLLTGKSIVGESPADTGVIGSAVAYIDRNISENIRVGELAKRLHISKFYLCHLFKSKTGTTISEYILLKRLAEAKRLLHESGDKISDIAVGLGFSSFSYFCAVFKKKFGMTPKEYRNRY